MKAHNITSLDNLAKTCKIGGLLPVFLGLLVAFVGLINKDTSAILQGVFIFIVGYGYIKTASKIFSVIKSET